MNQEQRDKIVDILYEAFPKVDKLPTIEEKRNKYLSILRFYNETDLLEFKIDVDSEEVSSIIENNLLNIEIQPPKAIIGDGYHPWLDVASSEIKWNYKQRFFKYLLKKKHPWSPENAMKLDRSWVESMNKYVALYKEAIK